MNTKGITHRVLGSGVGVFFLLAASSWAAQTQSLSGHVLPVTAKSQLVGPVPASRTLNLAIALPLRNQDELRTLLEQLYDPASPHYRRFLTPEQFAEQFGPTKEDYSTIIEFAKSHGFVVTQTHPNRTLLDVSGTVEDIEKAFQVSLKLYQHPTEPRVYHAPDREPSVELAVPILHIHGLDNFSVPRPLSHKREWSGNRNPLQLDGSGPGGAFLASDFRAAYVPGVALTGARIGSPGRI
jgi:subtilase family serine protease